MKLTTKIAAILLGAAATISSADAAFISGFVFVNAGVSSASVNQTANTVSFVPASPAANASINNGGGDYVPYISSNVTYSNFTYGPPMSAPNPLWITLGAAPGTASFQLTQITSIVEPLSGGVLLEGMGILSMTGFDDTPGVWSFSADTALRGTTRFNFSSTAEPNAVPDGGTTMALFGVSLLGLAGARRKFAK